MRGTWAMGTSGTGSSALGTDLWTTPPAGRAAGPAAPSTHSETVRLIEHQFESVHPNGRPPTVRPAGFRGGMIRWPTRTPEPSEREGRAHDGAAPCPRRRSRAPRTARLGGVDVADGGRRGRDLPAPPAARAVQGARRARPRGAALRRPDQAARRLRRPPPRARPRAGGGADDPRRGARARRAHRPGRP